LEARWFALFNAISLNAAVNAEVFMFQTATREITFEEFLDWYPDGYGRYELYDGAIVEMHQQEPMNK
jgi:hypothetical protein